MRFSLTAIVWLSWTALFCAQFIRTCCWLWWRSGSSFSLDADRIHNKTLFATAFTLRVNINKRVPYISSAPALSFKGVVHIGARAHVLNLIWFGNIARLSQWGGRRRGVISSFKWFLHAVATCRGEGSAPCAFTILHTWYYILRSLYSGYRVGYGT